jgi:hypothetical protein
MYNILVRKLQGKIFWNPRHRWMDNTKMYLDNKWAEKAWAGFNWHKTDMVTSSSIS